MLERRTRLGKYEVMEELGIGAMATVYKARNTEDGSPVAIKVPDRRLLTNVRALQQFMREGQALVRLRHPNIVRVHSVGQQNNLPYIVMDYVDGHTLSQEMHNRGKFSPEEVVEILLPIADALDYSHTEKTFHCDVKPGNIRLYRGRTPVLVDFGIVQTADGTVWDEGKPTGSVWYMSPEQARGERANERSDQYSLAIVAYEMLTGHVPFDGDNPYAIVLQQRDAKPGIPRDWSESLKTVLRKVLDKDPQQRYSSCLEFVRALQSAGREYLPSVAAPPVRATPDDLWTTEPDTTLRRPTEEQAPEAKSILDTSSVPKTNGYGQDSRPRKSEGPQKALYAGAAVFCLFFLGLIITLVLMRHHRTAQAAAQVPPKPVSASLSPSQILPASPTRSVGDSKEASASNASASPQNGKPTPAVRADNKPNAQNEFAQSSSQVKTLAPEPSKIAITNGVSPQLSAQNVASSGDPGSGSGAAPSLVSSKVNVAPTPAPVSAPVLIASAPTSQPPPVHDVDSAPIRTAARNEYVPPAPLRNPAPSEYVPPQLMHKVACLYPQSASNRSFSMGVVELKIKVGKDGKASNLKYVTGQMFFADAAIACVKQWQFAPATRDGQPVESEMPIKLTFGHE
jgi:TonB family protein